MVSPTVLGLFCLTLTQEAVCAVLTEITGSLKSNLSLKDVLARDETCREIIRPVTDSAHRGSLCVCVGVAVLLFCSYYYVIFKKICMVYRKI